MKRIIVALVLVSVTMGKAQDLNDIFVSGVADAERFANAYLSPVSEGAIYSISNGWYNTADAKPLGGFEISIIGNMTGFKNKDDKKAFLLDPADYENLDFVQNPGQARMVSTALGDIEGVEVFVEDQSGVFREDFELPSGLAAENLNFIPSGYIQASVGLIKGLEVKARFLPKIKFDDDAKLGLFGAGLQYDFTKILPADKVMPVAISAVIGYTNLNGEYDFTDSSTIEGSNQRIDASFKTWNFSAVVSTKNIPVINFYGGLGYITGKSDIDLLGTYQANGPFFSETVEDPFTVSKNASGVAATLGTKLKLGFFRLNAEYNIAEFSTFTFGVNFGFR
ncbi:MAG TPA: hypothetical protein DEF18_08880 [Muricauda sp.]|uniref:Outer membrane protein beta-barrel domain-containing protein n=1 Tax=Flagellimonas aurea TaxID=2915619 RepID=A0ABS3G3J0_9FLAO|nr:DUF6588 family protein [Allomuricauda aurea]MAO19006.1 hypothetical protein [Allomuricauda sp.]MBC73294.1 hypothetical protein [Allomuricauda sp.]MBO0353961.1 hypothetical protein [Allomuricauda aurea]HBU78201.1 hypothetical protein [Allomuricauda sp.]|tara:strand:- start:265 stop:1275 length:1011 start_codon:yes stop_codon:yes gene_type:complete